MATAGALAGELMMLEHLCYTKHDPFIYRPEFIAEGIMKLITDASRNGGILLAEPEKGFSYVE